MPDNNTAKKDPKPKEPTEIKQPSGSQAERKMPEGDPVREAPGSESPDSTETDPPKKDKEAHERGVQAERARVTEIQKIVRTAKLPETLAIRMINSGTSLKRARKEVLNELAQQSNEGGEIRSQITITRDEVDSRRAVVENALLNRFNPDKFKLDPAAREFRGMSLMDIGRDLMERRGIKTLRDAYEAAPQTFKPFSRQTINPDFKPVNRTQLGDAPSLEAVNESGEFKRGSVSDAKETYQLATYGKVVAVSRQVIINDDLDAFTRLPAMFGRAAADLESDTVWGIINSNPNMGDGNALFSATHGNLAALGSGAPISVATLGAGRAAMRQQKGLNGRFINVMAKYLIVPAAMETTGEQYVTQTNIIYTKPSDYNPFANKLQVLAEPRLDAVSTAAWYLAGDPGQIDTIEYAYLEGNEGVYLESRIGFDVDGLELKARLDFAAKAIDWRGFYMNAGA